MDTKHDDLTATERNYLEHANEPRGQEQTLAEYCRQSGLQDARVRVSLGMGESMSQRPAAWQHGDVAGARATNRYRTRILS